tara:strand:+ start:1074 stop:1715 length:642 start_codon:yes stop_codon:yes gene_type:complete
MNLILKLKTVLISFVIRNLNGDNFHNLNKFIQIYKIWNNIKLDSIQGDYIEFGIFKGKSLYHSVKTAKKINAEKNITFWGLDSFEGFPVENHEFYKAKNFKVSKSKVKKSFNKYKNVKIIDGYFEDTLTSDELQNIKNISFAFIDCDIYESSQVAFKFIKSKMTKGGFIMIDDFTSIDKNGNYIAKSFFDIFHDREVVFFDNYSNGQTFRILN